MTETFVHFDGSNVYHFIHPDKNRMYSLCGAPIFLDFICAINWKPNELHKAPSDTRLCKNCAKMRPPVEVSR